MVKQRKQSMLEGGLILTVALLIIKLLGWFYQIQLVRIIGEEGNGYYSTAYAIFGIVYALTVTGFPVALSKIVSEYASEGRYKDVQRAEKVSNRLFLAIGIFGVAFLAIIAPLYSRMPSIDDELLKWSIWSFTPAILFCCLMSVQRGYNQGLRNMTPTAISQVVETVVKVAVGLVSVYIVHSRLLAEYETAGTVMGIVLDKSGADTMIIAMSSAAAMLGVTASAIASWAFLAVRRWWCGSGILKAQINDSPEPYAGRVTMKRLLWLAIPISLSAATANLSGLIDNSMALGILSRLFETSRETVFASYNGLLELTEKTIDQLPMYLYGTYSMHNKIITLIPAITGSFGMSALPLVSSCWTRRDMQKTKKSIDASLRITMLIAAPAGIGIAILAEPITWLVYESRPVGAAIGIPMLRIMGIMAIFIALMGIVNAMLQAIGRTDVPIKLMVIGLLIKSVVNYFLMSIPSINIKGMPVGNLLLYLFICVMGLVILSKSTDIKIDIKGTMIKPLLAGLITGIAALGIYTGLFYLLERAKWSVLIAIVFAVVVYVILIGLFHMIERDDVLSLPGGKKLVPVLEKLRILR